jgi:hypothetical protein
VGNTSVDQTQKRVLSELLIVHDIGRNVNYLKNLPILTMVYQISYFKLDVLFLGFANLRLFIDWPNFENHFLQFSFFNGQNIMDT